VAAADSIGYALVSPVAARLADRCARWGYAFAAACGTGAVLACLLGLGRLSVPGLDRSPSAADAQATG